MSATATRTFAVNVALTCASCVVALLVGEVALRVMRYGERKSHEIGVNARSLPDLMQAGTRYFDTHLQATYSYDNDGFRVTPTGDAPVDGASATTTALSVAVVGDSFVFGAGVEDDETFAAQLQREVTGSRVRNLGVSGANTQQAALVAARYAAAMALDVLVIVVTGNDAEVWPWNLDPLTTCGVEPTRDELRAHAAMRFVYLARVVNALVSDNGCLGPTRCPSRFAGDAVQARCFRRSLLELGFFAGGRGAKVVVVYYPTPRGDWGAGEVHGDEAIAATVGQLAGQQGFAFVDLLPVFAPHGGAALKVAAHDDMHPNARAHGLAAARVAGVLREVMRQGREVGRDGDSR